MVHFNINNKKFLERIIVVITMMNDVESQATQLTKLTTGRMSATKQSTCLRISSHETLSNLLTYSLLACTGILVVESR